MGAPLIIRIEARNITNGLNITIGQAKIGAPFIKNMDAKEKGRGDKNEDSRCKTNAEERRWARETAVPKHKKIRSARPSFKNPSMGGGTAGSETNGAYTYVANRALLLTLKTYRIKAENDPSFLYRI